MNCNGSGRDAAVVIRVSVRAYPCLIWINDAHCFNLSDFIFVFNKHKIIFTVRAKIRKSLDPHFLFSMYPFWTFDIMTHYLLSDIFLITFTLSAPRETPHILRLKEKSQKGYKLLGIFNNHFSHCFCTWQTQVKTLQSEIKIKN